MHAWVDAYHSSSNASLMSFFLSSLAGKTSRPGRKDRGPSEIAVYEQETLSPEPVPTINPRMPRAQGRCMAIAVLAFLGRELPSLWSRGSEFRAEDFGGFGLSVLISTPSC